MSTVSSSAERVRHTREEPFGGSAALEDFSERPAVNVVAGREMIY
jgi:hypothetical protein